MLFFRDGGAVNFDISDPDDVKDQTNVLLVTLGKGDVLEVQKSALAMHRIKYFKRPVEEAKEQMAVQPSTGPEDLR